MGMIIFQVDGQNTPWRQECIDGKSVSVAMLDTFLRRDVDSSIFQGVDDISILLRF